MSTRKRGLLSNSTAGGLFEVSVPESSVTILVGPIGITGAIEPGRAGIGWLRIVPNPFTIYTRVLVGEDGRFRVFDVTGMAVGAYCGYSIGRGLPAGVYFLECRDKSGIMTKMVKLQ
jgi:hypothetical protein